MEEDIYHTKDIVSALRGINPHLKLKESVKNIGEFTLDLVMTLDGIDTRVQVSMDTFQHYDSESRKSLEARLRDGYGILLKKLHKRQAGGQTPETPLKRDDVLGV